MSELKKIGGVIVSHGQVANELVAAAETVVGVQNHLMAVSIGWHDDVEMAKNEIERAIRQVSQGSGVFAAPAICRCGRSPVCLALRHPSPFRSKSFPYFAEPI